MILPTYQIRDHANRRQLRVINWYVRVRGYLVTFNWFS